MAAAPPYALVWLLFVFAWISNYLVRMGFAALLPPVIAELGLSYAAAGVLASSFFGAYALMQVPAGVLGDRFGRRRVLLIGLWAGAAASVATGFAVSFATLLAARLATGASQGCLFSNDRAIIASVTPADRVALGQAVSFTGPGLGITAGLLLGGLLGERMSWRLAMAVVALPTLLAALLIARLVPSPPAAPEAEPLPARLARVVARGDLWWLALVGLCVMWVQYVLATWAPLLFMEAGVAELGRAGLYSSFQGLAGVGGLLLGGWMADRAERAGLGRRVVLLGTLVALAASTALLAAVVRRGPSAAALAAGLFLVALCAWGVWGPSFAVLGDTFPRRDLSTAFGLYNSVCVVGAFVGPAVTGWTRDVTGSFAAGCALAAGVAAAGVLATLALPRAPGRGPDRGL
jgi:MFS family permease